MSELLQRCGHGKKTSSQGLSKRAIRGILHRLDQQVFGTLITGRYSGGFIPGNIRGMYRNDVNLTLSTPRSRNSWHDGSFIIESNRSYVCIPLWEFWDNKALYYRICWCRENLNLDASVRYSGFIVQQTINWNNFLAMLFAIGRITWLVCSNFDCIEDRYRSL